MDDAGRPSFFGALPVRGVWTAVGLTRGEFFWILGVSLLLFTFWGGPIWSHLRTPHFARIAVSYAAIPLLVIATLVRSRRTSLWAIVGASGVLCALKLVITAGVTVALGLAA